MLKIKSQITIKTVTWIFSQICQPPSRLVNNLARRSVAFLFPRPAHLICHHFHNGRLLHPFQRDNGNYAARGTHYAARGLHCAARGLP